MCVVLVMSGEDSIRFFLVFDFGEGLQEVMVMCWSVVVGDDVEINQMLCLVEIVKVEVEIFSLYVGWIVELGGVEGDVFKVGVELVWIDIGFMVVVQFNGEGVVFMLVGYGVDVVIEISRWISWLLVVLVVCKLVKELVVDLVVLQCGLGVGGVIIWVDVLVVV